jgi:ankyrin repeat protein
MHNLPLYILQSFNDLLQAIALCIIHGSAKLFDAIYENNFELAKTLIDGGKVDVNTKNDYGDTPLIVTCQQTTLETEEEAVNFINYLWQGDI